MTPQQAQDLGATKQAVSDLTKQFDGLRREVEGLRAELQVLCQSIIKGKGFIGGALLVAGVVGAAISALVKSLFGSG